jgi:hypothetical protein
VEPRIRKSDLGFATVVLGCAWTIAAVALLVQSGPGRGRSPVAFIGLACLVGTVGCAMLAFAFFPGFVQRLRAVGWLCIGLASVLALAVVCSAWNLPPAQLQWFDNPGDARDASNLAVAASLIMLTCSISLITMRLLSNQASQHHFTPQGAAQAIFLMFWRQHKLVGWMALALSAAHSVYFLRYPRGFEEQWTGIVAVLLLGLLGVVGLVTSYRTRLRLWLHRLIAAGLAVVLTLHWPPILYAEAGALVVLGVTALLNLKLASAIVRWVVEPSKSAGSL